MDQREWNFRFASISAVVGVLLGLATMWLASILGDNSPKLDAITGLLTGLSGIIISMQILQGRELSSIEQLANDAINVGKRASNIGSTNSTLTRKTQRVQSLPPIIADTALRALKEAINGIDVEYDNHSTYIKGRRLALHCYAHFWSLIVAEQERSRKPMIARLTHSSDVGLFYDNYARSLKGLHSAFTIRGSIFRILVDIEAPDQIRIQRYLNAISDMNGIDCVYINVSENSYLLGDNNTLEYCLVEGKTNYCSEWRLKDSKDVKAHVVTTDMQRYNQYLSSWAGLIGFIRSHDFDQAGVDKSCRKKLIDLKMSFIDKYDLMTS